MDRGMIPSGPFKSLHIERSKILTFKRWSYSEHPDMALLFSFSRLPSLRWCALNA